MTLEPSEGRTDFVNIRSNHGNLNPRRGVGNMGYK